MALKQLIYTSTCTDQMTPLLSHQVSLKSVNICSQLGITGRVFADDQQAIAMTEGPSDIVMGYYKAIAADSLVNSAFIHVERKIPQREFKDYSVWLNSREIHDVGSQVHVLSRQTLASALPPNLSAKVRIMIEAFLKPELLYSRINTARQEVLADSF